MGADGRYQYVHPFDYSIIPATPEVEFSHAQDDLDINDSFKDLYVMLDRVDVHCIWVSNKVLSLLPDDIVDIPGGEIPAKGVFCDNAMDIVLKQYPKPTKEAKTKFIKNAMRELNKFGIVGMHDAGITPSELKLYSKLSSDADWTVRVNAMIECDERNTFCPENVYKVSSPIGKLRVRSVKLFAGKTHPTLSYAVTKLCQMELSVVGEAL